MTLSLMGKLVLTHATVLSRHSVMSMSGKFGVWPNPPSTIESWIAANFAFTTATRLLADMMTTSLLSLLVPVADVSPLSLRVASFRSPSLLLRARNQPAPRLRRLLLQSLFLSRWMTSMRAMNGWDANYETSQRTYPTFCQIS